MTQQEVRNSFDEKLKRAIFEPVARWITGPDAEDRLQDGICQTYEMYARTRWRRARSSTTAS